MNLRKIAILSFLVFGFVVLGVGLESVRPANAREVAVQEYKNVDFYANCDGTYNVTIETNTNRNWRVNGQEQWINNGSATWNHVSSPFTIEWFHQGEGWVEVNSQTPGYTFTRHPLEEDACMVVCLDGENELSIPKTREALQRVRYSYPEVEVGTCPAPEPEPEPTPEPKVEEHHDDTTDHNSAGSAPSYCGNGEELKAPENPHVYRQGDVAEVKWIPTAGDKVHIYYKVNGADGWQFSTTRSNTGSEFIEGLGSLDISFAIQQENGDRCVSPITPTIVDGATDGWVLFRP